ncbi:MAG TPA: PAN domain-containing protein [Hyphomicrobiaceae bacterium]|nr:PAN domain-containing protein [Hyphomicrobiaceae bacterium]
MLVGIWLLPGLGCDGALAESARSFTREVNIDRSGNDIERVEMDPSAGIDACEQLCRSNAACVAFTYVKQSTTVPRPICRLKDQKPFGHQSSCCVSGVLK